MNSLNDNFGDRSSIMYGFPKSGEGIALWTMNVEENMWIGAAKINNSFFSSVK